MCRAAIMAGTRIVFANEIDSFACQTYRHNFDHGIVEKDIRAIVDKGSIPDHDILMAGFPCQSFSVAGDRKGFEDERGKLFFQIMDVVDAKRPRMMLLENVSNLKSHDKGNTYSRIVKEISSRGYNITDEILNSKDYVPQNRPRIFVVCSLGNLDTFQLPRPKSAPPLCKFLTGQKDPESPSLSSLVNFDGKQDQKYYLPHKSKYYKLFKHIKRGKVYQLRRYYVRENMSGICPTLTANMGGGGHNVPFVRDKKDVRKLTEHECLSLQGFEGFSFPEEMALSHRYKQIGNSVTVPLVKEIVSRMIRYLGEKS